MAPHGITRPCHQTRERAKHLLVHRANGGIHNAAIALRLVTNCLAASGAPPQDAGFLVAAGVRGTADAARALKLLGALVGLESASVAPEADAFVDDIANILHTESRQYGVTVDMKMADRAPSAPALPVESLAEMLIAGLFAVESAIPNSALVIRARQTASPSEKPLTVEIEVAPGDTA